MNLSLSVVIPTINREKKLSRAIDSVLEAVINANLDQKKVEIIVVNDSDGRVDLGGNTVNDSNVRLVTVRSSAAPFGGPSVARHTGVLKSKSELIFFLDDDDYFLSNRFQYCLELYRDSSVDGVLEPSLRRDTTTNIEHIAGAKGRVRDAFLWMLAGTESSHIATGATSFRRRSYEDIGGMDLALMHGEDGELLLRLAYYKSLSFTYPEAVVVCERHDTNTSHVLNRRRYQNMQSIHSLYRNTRDRNNASYDQNLKQFICAKYDYLLYCCINENTYVKRVIETLKVSYHFPWQLANLGNVKSLLIALMKFKRFK